MKLYYMRDNHTFLPLPEDDVDAAIDALRQAYVVEGYSHGMLCTKRLGAPESAHGRGREHWSVFQAQARVWLSAMLKPYKTPGDLEYESWPCGVPGRCKVGDVCQHEQWCRTNAACRNAGVPPTRGGEQ